jgi:hypothetical protein
MLYKNTKAAKKDNIIVCSIITKDLPEEWNQTCSWRFCLRRERGCTGGQKGLAATYPILPSNVLDIIPTVKHAAVLTSGFVSCSFTRGISSLSIQVLLPDAKNVLNAAQLSYC